MTSAWTMLVLPALAFRHGMATAWIILAIVIQLWIAWLVLAKRLRRFTVAANDALTTPEFLEKRFGDHSGTLRTVTALVLILFIVIYVSSALVAGSKLVAVSFGLQYEIGVIVALIAIASYTFIGGFLAVSRTDVFQALFMLGGLLILTNTLLFQTEGNLAQTNVDVHGLWKPFVMENASSPSPIFFLTILGWGIGVFGSQRVIQRIIAIGSTARIDVSRKIGVSWVAIIYVLSMAVCLLALPALLNTGTLDQVLEDQERIYIVLTNTLFHPIIIGILLVAVIAAIMRTADSQLLLASAVATDDLPVIRRFTHDLGNGGRVWLGRFLLVIISGATAVFSIFHPESVLDLVTYAWGGMGAAFGPVTILALYWPPVQRLGSAGIDFVRHGDRVDLGNLDRRSVPDLGHPFGYTWFPLDLSDSDRDDIVDGETVRGGYWSLRQRELRETAHRGACCHCGDQNQIFVTSVTSQSPNV